MASSTEKKIEKNYERMVPPPHVREIVETILGCKWSLTLLTMMREGIHRPGKMHRSVEGLTPKVMNHCLGKMLTFGLIEKTVFPEVPPRVEYRITPFGQKFMRVFEVIDELDRELARDVTSR